MKSFVVEAVSYMQAYYPGQRCISDTESELGLGMVLEFDGRRVTIAFAAVEESRTYVADNAPLTRLRFLPGDKIQSGEGWWLTVEQVEEDGPLLLYHGLREDGSQGVLPEQRLSERVQFNQPRERLLAGQIEHNRWFNARAEAQYLYHQLKASPLHGLTGVRGELLPHQLYVAQTISERESPRVLLADEVGLGKTIEAGMVMHRMLLNERISRVLVVVPEALQHQWLVEMLRRFNLSFSLFDADRLEAMREPEEEHLSLEEALMDANFSLDPPANPFSEQQLVLCSMNFLCDPETSDLALDAGWDMLIVDEAHHLAWTEEQPSEAYCVIDQLAAETPSILLLTATPEQLGNDSHFARLRLLDSDRYASLSQFKADQANYQQVADAAAPLLSEEPLTAEQQQALAAWLDEDSQALAADPDLGPVGRRRLVSTLVDRTGTGRVLMRNTRAAVQGFAPRVLQQYHLESSNDEATGCWWRTDARVKWLIDTLRSNYPRRYLLICSSANTALDLAEALRVIAGIVPAVFHEGMSILDCDRAAAHFADPESGAPVLVCSEIGSEGRNFQFVSDLILFDLPDAPGLLEQRIGRLDRIGQRNTINIHVPFITGSREETLCQWYHYGLDAFEKTCTVGEAVLEDLDDELQQLLLAGADASTLNNLIEKTAERAGEVRVELENGRDKLLEMNSFNEAAANALKDQIVAEEEKTPWDFFERAADCFGLEIEQLSSSHHSIQVGSRSELPSFPGLGNDGIISVTCDRETALAREDVAFMSWEHPLVLGALEMLVDGDQGKVSVGALKAQPFKAGEVLIESIFAVHCQGAERLGFRRFMGHTLQRFLHTSTGLDIASKVPQTWMASRVETVKKGVARQLLESQQESLVERIGKVEAAAEEQLPALRQQAQQRMHDDLGAELKRMQALKLNNPAIRDDEIERMTQRIEALDACLGGMQLRFDALRVVFCY